MIPVLRDVVDWLKGLAEKAENMNPKTIEMFVKALLGLAAVGPIVGVVGRLLTSLGSVAGFAASVSGELAALNAGFGTSATTAGLFAKGLGALGPLLAPPHGLVIAGILAGVGVLIALNKHMSESAIQTDIFGDKVSEGTKKAVGGFLELSDEAERSLSSLKATGEVVSQETVDSIAGNFENMGGQISKKIDESKQPAIDSLTQMYTDMGTIQDEETVNLINKVGSTYDGIKQKTEEGQARVKEILETAKNEKRTLTEQEQYEIATIQYQMKDDGIRILSESEEEYYIIRQRMKDQAGELSAEQAGKIVEDSITTRDETIAKAEEEYNERLKYAAQLEADGSAESASLAEKLKEDALTTKEQTIADAKERHEKIVSEAKTQAGEHVNEVDWETGHIMTGWEMAWNSVSKSFETGWNSTKTFFGNMRRSILDFTADADRKIGEFKEGVKRKGKEIIEGFINGMIKKWTDRATGLWDLIANTIDGIVEHIKGMFDFTLPMPRIPRPSIHWETHSVLGMDFSIPSGISWHKKGAIFTRPTLFATGSGFHGVGEAGAEAVLPIEKLDGIVANAMIKAGGSNNGVTITGNTFNVREEEDIEKIARKLYRLIESKKRGVGLG